MTPRNPFVCLRCAMSMARWFEVCQNPNCRGRGTVQRAAALRAEPKIIAPEDDFLTPASEVPESHTPRLLTGIDPVDRLFGGDDEPGLAEGSVIQFGGNPGIGKCLAGDTELYDPTTGSLTPIRDLAARPRGAVVALDEKTLQWVESERVRWIPSGLRKVYRLRTVLGRELVLTGNHPLYTQHGWRDLQTIGRGDVVLTPGLLPYHGDNGTSVLNAKCHGYALASYRTDRSTRPIRDPRVIDAINRTLEALGSNRRLAVGEKWDWYAEPFRWDGEYPRGEFPKVMLGASRPALVAFLRALLNTIGGFDASYRRFYVTLPSRKIAQRIQHLLLRFGVVTSTAQYNLAHERRLEVNDPAHLLALSILLGDKVPDRDAILSRSESYSTHRIPIPRPQWSAYKAYGCNKESLSGFALRAKALRIARTLDDEFVQRRAQTHLVWDAILSIEPAGEQAVYDVEVPKHHSFVANDVLVHNSTLLIAMADALRDESLYLTSEEDKNAIAKRARRLKLPHMKDVLLCRSLSIEKTMRAIRTARRRFVVVDSLQGQRKISEAMEQDYIKALENGEKLEKHTPATVLECAFQLIQIARKIRCTMILVSHATKGGDLNGFMEIEHMVDCSIWYSGDPNGKVRILRARKNREGPTNVTCKLWMTKQGLVVPPKDAPDDETPSVPDDI